MRVALRFLGVSGLAFWLGGIAFYGAVAIPAAHEILGGHREIGFVTRSVTGTAHALGFAALAALLANTIAAFPASGRRVRVTLVASLAAMALAQLALVALRNRLDGLLDPAAMSIADRPRFLWLHERYLNATSALCLAGLAHLWALLLPSKPARQEAR